MLAQRAIAVTASTIMAVAVLSGCTTGNLPATGTVTDSHRSFKRWEVCVTADDGTRGCGRTGVLSGVKHCHKGDRWPDCKRSNG